MLRIIFDISNLGLISVYVPHIKNTITADGRFDTLAWSSVMFETMHSFILKAMLDFKTPRVEVVLAMDPPGKSWRHEAYPLYKANRPKDQMVDKTFLKACFSDLGEALEKHLRFIPCAVPGAEADDIIATLTKDAEAQGRRTVIYSTDADFIQLLSDKVHAYRPISGYKGYAVLPGELKIAGTPVWCENREQFLQLSVLTGQAGKDGIFNIKCPDEIPAGKRRPPFGVKAAQKVLDADQGIEDYVLEKFGAECVARYERNNRLINFEKIPEEIGPAVLAEFSSVKQRRGDACSLIDFVKDHACYMEVDGEDLEDLGELYAVCIQ